MIILRAVLKSGSMLLFLFLVGLGAISSVYGYYSYTKISTVRESQPLDYPGYTWVGGLSIWWTLSSGDHVQLSMQVDPRLNPSDVHFNVSILQGIAPTTLQTVGLLQTWNISWARWMNLANGIFTLNFTASHYYNIRLGMFINANTNSTLSQPMLTFAVIWRDPMDVSNGLFFLGSCIALFALSTIPFLYPVIMTKLGRKKELG